MTKTDEDVIQKTSQIFQTLICVDAFTTSDAVKVTILPQTRPLWREKMSVPDVACDVAFLCHHRGAVEEPPGLFFLKTRTLTEHG